MIYCKKLDRRLIINAIRFNLYLILFAVIMQSNAQQITNIKVGQEGDDVVIFYDLMYDSVSHFSEIEVIVSDDYGITFSIYPKSIEGDFTNVTKGSNKKIIWHVLNDREDLAGNGFVFKLLYHAAGVHHEQINSEYPVDTKDRRNEAGSYTGSSGTFVDYRDNHVYKWVKIGKQIWMAENLAYLPAVSLPSISSKDNPCYYVYGYDLTNVSQAKEKNSYKKFGVLYNWMASGKACPEGWHLPSDDEWLILSDYLGGKYVSGGKMKNVNEWQKPNTGGSNISGFSALPGGYRYLDGTFRLIGSYGYWWSSTERSGKGGWDIALAYNSAYIGNSDEGLKEAGFSVRCLKD